MFSLKNTDPLITQELVDKINNNPHSTFKANPGVVDEVKVCKNDIGDAKKFLSPTRPIASNHRSAIPVGANENFMHNIDKRYITGITNVWMPANP